LFKPPTTPLQSLSFKLAPLIIQEAGPSVPSAEGSARFGALEGEQVDPRRPAVYGREGEILVHGKTHLRLTYAWFYPTNYASPIRPTVCGFQVVLNSAGEPVIWETLPNGGEVRTFFVADSLEQAAAAEFGAPLKGRRYSTEPDVKERPGVLVARLLEDGPIPMGPIVYVAGPDDAITTILCRCMSAQTSNIVQNINYELLPLETLAEEAQSALNSGGGSPENEAAGVKTEVLERWLRLPSSF
jgi:hypothetical protein